MNEFKKCKEAQARDRQEMSDKNYDALEQLLIKRERQIEDLELYYDGVNKECQELTDEVTDLRAELDRQKTWASGQIKSLMDQVEYLVMACNVADDGIEKWRSMAIERQTQVAKEYTAHAKTRAELLKIIKASVQLCTVVIHYIRSPDCISHNSSAKNLRR